jgi:hypothetical protein
VFCSHVSSSLNAVTHPAATRSLAAGGRHVAATYAGCACRSLRIAERCSRGQDVTHRSVRASRLTSRSYRLKLLRSRRIFLPSTMICHWSVCQIRCRMSSRTWTRYMTQSPHRRLQRILVPRQRSYWSACIARASNQSVELTPNAFGVAHLKSH